MELSLGGSLDQKKPLEETAMPSCFNWYLLKAPPTGTLWAPTDTRVFEECCSRGALVFSTEETQKVNAGRREIDARRFSFLPNVLGLFRLRDASPNYLG